MKWIYFKPLVTQQQMNKTALRGKSPWSACCEPGTEPDTRSSSCIVSGLRACEGPFPSSHCGLNQLVLSLQG